MHAGIRDSVGTAHVTLPSSVRGVLWRTSAIRMEQFAGAKMAVVLGHTAEFRASGHLTFSDAAG